MNILYDHQVFFWQRYGGISRYFYEIIRRIALKESVFLFEGNYINDYGLEKLNEVKKYYGKRRPGIKYTGRIFRYLSRYNLIKFAQELLVDVYHPTYYEDFNINKGKLIITVHDMIHELYSIDSKIIEIKKSIINKADGIICVSECTKNDLINILDIDENKIEVIYLGNSLNIEIKDNRLVKEPYILYVGNRGGYKNFDKYLQAIGQSKFKYEIIPVCFGGGNFNKNELQLIEKYGFKNKIKLFSGDDRILANLYKNAEIFVFPSLYEGFGIPPLEAMHYGTPVIASNVASIPEVVGNAGIYFNPNDVEDIADKIDAVLNDKQLKKLLQIKGIQREKLFSWDNCASETLKFYKSISKGGK